MVELGDKAPELELVDTDKKPVKIPFESGKVTMLAFFPGAFTAVCTKEMCTLRDSLSKLSPLGAELFAVSVDSPFSNKAFKEKNALNFPVLSDYTRKAIKAFGIELPNFSQLSGYVAAKRSVFIFAKDGRLSFKWISDDPSKEPDYNMLMQEISRLK